MNRFMVSIVSLACGIIGVGLAVLEAGPTFHGLHLLPWPFIAVTWICAGVLHITRVKETKRE